MYFLASAICLIAIAVWIEKSRGTMDQPTFILCLLLRYFGPRNYPVDEKDAKRWRGWLNVFQKSAFFKFQGVKEDVELTAEDGSPFSLRVYVPSNPDPSNPIRPTLVWFHGGGWSIGGILSDDKLVGRMATEANMIAISVGFRLAPEHPYPAAVHDCSAALRWLRANISRFGGDTNTVYLAGESSGGNLAAAMTSINLDTSKVPRAERIHIKGVVLIYPSLSGHGDWPSAKTYGDFGILSSEQHEHFRKLYSNGNAAVRDEYAFAPLNTPPAILARYPPTLFLLAKYDPLSDESMEFITKLRDAGATVDIRSFPTSTHAFFGLDVLPSGIKALTFAASFLKAWTSVQEQAK